MTRLPALVLLLALPALSQRAAAPPRSHVPEAFRPLLLQLKEGTPQARQSALFRLGKQRPLPAPVLRVMVEALDDPDRTVRLTAAVALSNVGGAAVPELVRVLRDSRSAEARQAALVALRELREQASPVLPDMVESLQDNDQAVRQTAALALVRMGEASLGPLLERLADLGPEGRLTAGAICARLGDRAILALAERATSGPVSARLAALEALQPLAPKAQAVLVLRRALADEDAAVRAAASRLLARSKEARPEGR